MNHAIGHATGSVSSTSGGRGRCRSLCPMRRSAMQYRRSTALASALLAASIGFSAVGASADMQLDEQDPPSFDKSAFEQSANRPSGKVMGYSFLIMKDGKLVARGGNKARNRADGFKLMTTSSRRIWAACSSSFPAYRCCTSWSSRRLDRRAGRGSFASRLDSPVALLYPQIWQNAIETPGSAPSPSASCCSTSPDSAAATIRWVASVGPSIPT